ncbi:MAG: hypothetical protein P9M14_15530 [Candidatus Alcyoniella australis]|nr:hypothetical protein [Candidatus Alcyoniella australis]
MTRFALAALCALLALCLWACETDEGSADPDYQELIALGSANLEIGEHQDAYCAFSQALDLRPSSSAAHWGIALSDLLLFVDAADLLYCGETFAADEQTVIDFCRNAGGCGLLELQGLSYDQCLERFPLGLDQDQALCVAQAANCSALYDCVSELLPPDSATCAAACFKLESCGELQRVQIDLERCELLCPVLYSAKQIDCYIALEGCESGREQCFAQSAPWIQDWSQDFYQPVVDEQLACLERVVVDPAFEFRLGSFNYELFDMLLQVSLAGRHDRAEAHFVAAQAELIHALLTALPALDLDYNQRAAASVFLDLPRDLNELYRQLPALYLLLDYLVDDPLHQGFLGLGQGAKPADLAAVAPLVAQFFGNLESMIEQVDTQAGDQSADAIRFVDYNADGAWNDDEPLQIQGLGQLQRPAALALAQLCGALRNNFAHGAPVDAELLRAFLDQWGSDTALMLLGLLELNYTGQLDPGALLRDPGQDGLRPLLFVLHDLIGSLADWGAL